ncbi:hypothetical protein DBP12_03270 [Streptomyces sp. CS014]|nr:hypothetical protein DBP12_03270 [Streptomyces sp. CS014]
MHPRTAENHGYGLLRYLRWCADKGVDPATASAVHVAQWADSLEPADPARCKPLADGTINNRLTAVSVWYWHLVQRGLLDGNPVMLVRRCPGTDEITTPLATPEYCVRLVHQAEQYRGFMRHRGAVMLGLLITTGARISEVLGLDVDDYTARVDKPCLAMGVGKGGGTRLRVMHPVVAGWLDRWLTEYAELRSTTVEKLREKGGHLPLFITASGNRMDYAQFRKYLRRLCELAEISDRLTPHSFRYGFITQARDMGYSLDQVSGAVGHRDVAVTERYDRAYARLTNEPGVEIGRELDEGLELMREANSLLLAGAEPRGGEGA